jgi:cytochrome c oxidase cbb3-type subunit IV
VDLSDLRTIVTALSFIAFLGVVVWAYNSNQKARFDEAANLPFVDEDEGVGNKIVMAQRAPGDRHG